MRSTVLLLALSLSGASAFVPVSRVVAPRASRRRHAIRASAADEGQDELSRREAMGRTAAAAVTTAGALGIANLPAYAVLPAAGATVLVAGATGNTGARILKQLSSKSGVTTIGGVRSPDKAKAKTGVAVDYRKVDLTAGVEALAESCKGCNAVISAVGFVPGSPFSMQKEAHAVDNVGTIALIDACVKAGVGKFVLVSSILTNGRSWGQEKSPGFVITNAFGGVLDEKIVAENYLRKSGLDYTIVRPGGLKAEAPSGQLEVHAEDTLNSGEISRDLVASVCIEALFNKAAEKKVVEIIEGEGPKVPEAKWFDV